MFQFANPNTMAVANHTCNGICAYGNCLYTQAQHRQVW